MEDTLRVAALAAFIIAIDIVLILVLMEDTLRAFSMAPVLAAGNVLILVLMEDTLRVRMMQ